MATCRERQMSMPSSLSVRPLSSLMLSTSTFSASLKTSIHVQELISVMSFTTMSLPFAATIQPTGPLPHCHGSPERMPRPRMVMLVPLADTQPSTYAPGAR